MSNSYDLALARFRERGWLGRQQALVERFAAGIDGAAVADAAAHFMVARQFRKIDAVRANDFDEAATLVRDHARTIEAAGVPTATTSLAEALALLPNARGRPVSAASKFLWCAAPASAVIYDQWARAQLAARGHRIPHRDYGAYYDAWQAEFATDRPAIRRTLRDAGLAHAVWLEGKLFDYALYDAGRPSVVE